MTESQTSAGRRRAEIVAPFIDGELTNSRSDATEEVIDPSNGRCLFAIPAGSDADVDRAVCSARAGFERGCWADAPTLRSRALHRLADLVYGEAASLDALDAGEMGKPVHEPFANAAAAAGLMRFYAEAVDKVTGDVYTEGKSRLVAQRRVPRGVVAAVVPWNFPTYNAVLKSAPALAAGNSVVLKPSEMSSRSAIRLANLAMEAGLPPGIFNVVPGLGSTIGRALGLHADVDMLTFTGSTAVGKKMMQYAGQSNMKAVLAECGGKSPQIVFNDGVDLDAAAETIGGMLLINQGQLCSVGSRLVVQRSIETPLIEKIANRLKRIVMGNALDPRTTFGPLVSATQCSRVMEYIESAGVEGGELVLGGKRALLETGGFFVEPTLFRKVAPESRVAQDEIFGPVLTVTTFQDEAEAIRIANSTMYGLMAYVWTTHISTGLRMARGIRSSIVVHANAPTGEGAGYASSFEPARQSGIGTEGGLAGMESYLRRQLVCINHS